MDSTKGSFARYCLVISAVWFNVLLFTSTKVLHVEAQTVVGSFLQQRSNDGNVDFSHGSSSFCGEKVEGAKHCTEKASNESHATRELSENGEAIGAERRKQAAAPEQSGQATALEQIEQATALERSEQATALEQIEQATAPEQIEQATASKQIEQATAPEQIEQVAAPEQTEEVAAPEQTEEVAAPEKTEQAAAPERTEQATPEQIEQATAPEQTEQAAEPEQIEQAAEPEQIEQAAAPELTEQAAEPEHTEQTTAPEKREQAVAPEQIEQAAEPEQIKQAAEPEQIEQAAAPEQIEQAAAPEQIEQAAAPEQIEQAAAPEQIEQAAEPEQTEQTTAPEKREQAAAPEQSQPAAGAEKEKKVAETAKAEQNNEAEEGADKKTEQNKRGGDEAGAAVEEQISVSVTILPDTILLPIGPQLLRFSPFIQKLNDVHLVFDNGEHLFGRVTAVVLGPPEKKIGEEKEAVENHKDQNVDDVSGSSNEVKNHAASYNGTSEFSEEMVFPHFVPSNMTIYLTGNFHIEIDQQSVKVFDGNKNLIMDSTKQASTKPDENSNNQNTTAAATQVWQQDTLDRYGTVLAATVPITVSSCSRKIIENDDHASAASSNPFSNSTAASTHSLLPPALCGSVRALIERRPLPHCTLRTGIEGSYNPCNTPAGSLMRSYHPGGNRGQPSLLPTVVSRH